MQLHCTSKVAYALWPRCPQQQTPGGSGQRRSASLTQCCPSHMVVPGPLLARARWHWLPGQRNLQGDECQLNMRNQ
eukprot:scaffold236_cov419-Prasinococcus_capsulatus_cf.AAC.12